MSVEHDLITAGELCRFYGFTLAETRSLETIERDIFVRYMNMVHRLQNNQRKKSDSYGDE